MARHKKINSTKELVEYWEAEVLRTKKAYDDALEKLKEARDKEAKEMQEVQIYEQPSDQDRVRWLLFVMKLGEGEQRQKPQPLLLFIIIDE